MDSKVPTMCYFETFCSLSICIDFAVVSYAFLIIIILEQSSLQKLLSSKRQLKSPFKTDCIGKTILLTPIKLIHIKTVSNHSRTFNLNGNALNLATLSVNSVICGIHGRALTQYTFTMRLSEERVPKIAYY